MSMSSFGQNHIARDGRCQTYSWSKQFDLIDWLECEPDLVAVVDADLIQTATIKSTSPPFVNRALRSLESLNNLISPILTFRKATTLSPKQQDFQRWLLSVRASNQNRVRQSLLFEDHIWSSNVLYGRWIVVRGTLIPSHTIDTHNIENTATEGSSQISHASQYASTVRCFMSEPLTAHQAFVRDFDWESTPLGAMANWDSQLIETVSLTLTSTDPAAVFWGSQMTSIYNEAFISIAGQKHPAMMGDSPSKAFAEVWDQFFEPRVQLSRNTRMPFSEQGLCLMLERRGFPEETFMTFTFLPLLGYSSEVVGFYHTVTEETQQVLSKRRMSLLLSASEVLSNAQTLESFWTLLIRSLADFEYDVPFVVLHSLSETSEWDAKLETLSSDTSSSEHCRLEGSLGYPPEHVALSKDFWLHDDNSMFTPEFRASMRSRTPRLLSSDDMTLPTSLVQGLQKRGYGNECNTVTIYPLRPTTHDTALGFLTIGLSSRRPYDEDYQSFLNLLVKNISSSLASVVLLVDEKRRGLNNAERAAYESAQLTARLQERELENQFQEHKFTVMAHQVPVGIFDLAPSGNIIFCNQAWCEMTKYNGQDPSMVSWFKLIHEDDRALVYREWTSALVNCQSVSFEARFQTPWQAESGEDAGARLDSTWFLARMSPIVADDGHVINVVGSFTNISFQKYTMAQQIQRVEEAIEAKRQQENFVDMTSHEMRNPLNAMLLCAQELSENLQSITIGAISDADKDALANCAESANTIIYCGRHQRRIIDDVLILSKLDAKLLQITPIDVQPIVLVQETLKLFESEVRAQGIEVELQIEDSIQQLNMTRVMLDPSRVVQIMVNFIANAIKFTKTEDIRRMLVRVGASRDEPSTKSLAAARIKLVPHGGLYQDPTTSKAWGNGDPVYLQFVVRDTGPGISGEDMIKLFNRFAQTRPKTHAHYGGSGLGLFISQQLAELQGGRVGIASEQGIGSSFYFYIKAKVASPTPAAGIPAESQVLTTSSRRASNSTEGTTSTTEAMTNRNSISILIVEDNIVNQRVLKRQLQKLGYNIFVANHGEEALEIVCQSEVWNDKTKSGASGCPLHVILMDIEMPVMDGRECVSRIREYERQDLISRRLPIIALTANARPEQISGAMEYGFDEVISKPFQLSQVVGQIAKVLDQNI